MPRIIRDTQGDVQFELYNEDGVLTNVDGDPASVAAAIAVTASDGAAITGSPFTATKVSTGIYECTLSPTVTAQMDRLDATFTAPFGGASQKSRQQIEVCGGHFVTLAELRTFQQKALNDTAKFPTADLRREREDAEDDLEDACDLAFVARARRVTLNGSGTARLVLPDRRLRRIVTLKVDGVAYTAAELADLVVGDRHIIRDDGTAFPAGDGNVEVFYEHGLDRPTPQIRRAAKILVYDRLSRPQGIGFRSISHTDEHGGTRQFTVASRRRRFGIPDVDAAVAAFDNEPMLGIV